MVTTNMTAEEIDKLEIDPIDKIKLCIQAYRVASAKALSALEDLDSFLDDPVSYMGTHKEAKV